MFINENSIGSKNTKQVYLTCFFRLFLLLLSANFDCLYSSFNFCSSFDNYPSLYDLISKPLYS